MGALEGKTIVLIAGQPKAGTTSLFDWLAQHPTIGAGKLKELRFFTDPSYPLQVPLRFDGTNLDAYLDLFNHPERDFLLDASPDYIGCHAPLQLPSLHPAAKAILLFREPVERMISAFRYYRSLGLLPQEMDFDAYIQKQAMEGVTPKTRSEYRALDHCRAAHHIQRWRGAFGDKLLVLDFAELRDAPQEVFERVCSFIGIPRPVDIKFAHGNKTKTYRSPRLYRLYANGRRSFAQLTLNVPFIYKLLKPLARAIVGRLQVEQGYVQQVGMSDRSRKTILEYAGTK